MSLTPITSPQVNATWFVGGNYNVTWDSTFPIFNDSNCSYGRGVLDIEITKKYISNATETAVFKHNGIKIASESFNLDVKEDTWNVSISTYKDFVYKLYLIPGGFVSSESYDRTKKSDFEETCSPHVTISVLLASPEPSSSSAVSAQSSTIKTLATSSGTLPSASPSSESATLGKKSLNTFVHTAIAVFIALAVIA
ncbi:hypothetical protein INT47_001544 [Mucor saturninus]|uniref:Uncharacterized protein n=1 Tax=Mucor saturninus TaxID=64648 RepID=A0A8H7QSY8_9FUNG|nr:hypothetical protein INT47_001544 [Mucor saturninus]